MTLFKRNNRAFRRYQKNANTRRNEWRRRSRWHPSRHRKPLEPHLRMYQWVVLPVDPNNSERGDLDAEPIGEIELRKQEADFTNYFLIQNGQTQRYEMKSEWINHKWKKRLEKDS